MNPSPASASAPPDDLRIALDALRAGSPQRTVEICQPLLDASADAPPARRADIFHLLGLAQLRLGQLSASRANLSQAVELAPENALAWNSFAEVWRKAGELTNAINCCRRALALQPDLAAAWNNLGLSLAAGRDFSSAAQAFERAANCQGGRHASAWMHLGGVLLETGQIERAIESLQTALRLDSRLLTARLHLAEADARRGNYPGAFAHLAAALRAEPNASSVHLALGRLFLETDQFAPALGHCARCRQIDPQLDAALLYEARANAGLGETRAAIALLKRYLRARPEEAAAWLDLGEFHAQLDQSAQALKCFERARQIESALGPALARLALWHDQQGDNAAARRLLQDAGLPMPDDVNDANADADDANAAAHVAGADAADVTAPVNAAPLSKTVQPPHADLLLAYGSVHLYGNDDPAAIAATLEAAVGQRDDLTPRQRSKFDFAIARLLDRAGQYERAFEFAQRGHSLYAGLHDPAPSAADFRLIEETFSPTRLAELPRAVGLDAHLPIFIVGMPRSGTSLVEQILAAHPAVGAGGELPFMAQLAREAPLRALPSMPGRALRELGQRYLAELRQLHPRNKRITDKTSNNFLHLGLIWLLWPGATILHCRRDPLDACLSCYFQDFGAYCRDLGHLGAYCRQYLHLMEHWRQTLPDLRMRDVPYEELVREPEPVIRRVLDFCGLEWNEACLRAEGRRRVVHTTSVAQVREPMHERSVGRHAYYERFLVPLRRALEG
jgi:tetratricopeptide (TPR) repeat protein